VCDGIEIEIEWDGQRFDEWVCGGPFADRSEELLREHGYLRRLVSGTPAERVDQALRLAEGHHRTKHTPRPESIRLHCGEEHV